jgi:hypothetical protein
MSNTFEYVIKRFDAETKTLKVEFTGGGWAEITLLEPLPSSIEEVDALVARFTGTKGHSGSVTDASDLSFILACLDKPRIAERIPGPAPVHHVRNEELPAGAPLVERPPQQHPRQVMVLKPFRV